MFPFGLNRVFQEGRRYPFSDDPDDFLGYYYSYLNLYTCCVFPLFRHQKLVDFQIFGVDDFKFVSRVN